MPESLLMCGANPKMKSTTCRFKQHHLAICTELDGDVALFQSKSCEYLVLNETGSTIWNALKSQPTLIELCKYLEETYEVNPDECKISVEAWLENGLSEIMKRFHYEGPEVD